MKIAFVKDVMSTGRGADRAVAALMNCLSERGHSVALVTLQDAGTPFSVALDRRIQIVRSTADDVAAAADWADVIVSTGTNEAMLLVGARKPIVQPLRPRASSGAARCATSPSAARSPGRRPCRFSCRGIWPRCRLHCARGRR